MLMFTLLCGLILALVSSASGNGDMGPGRWLVINIQVCEDDEKYEHRFEINRHKINRTHDGFNAKMNLEKTIDESFGIRIDLCKYVDGGCKPCQVLSDDSFVNFVRKYAKENMEKGLSMAKVDPPDFPLNSGYYEIEDYVFDYCELPLNGIYGRFGAKGYLLKDKQEVGCVDFTVEFENEDASCEESDDEE